MPVTDAMEQKLGPKPENSLKKRLITAVVVIPLVLLAIWMGKPIFDSLAILILLCLVREWSNMTLKNTTYPLGYLLAGLSLALLYTDLSLKYYVWIASAFIALAALGHAYHKQRLRDFTIFTVGALYICWSVYILIYMVHEGLQFFFIWLLLIIWSSDTGAYFAGRRFGGPKLAPSISPNKTWSGFVGGLVVATGIGTISGAYLQDLYPTLGQMALVALYLSLVSHLGDLLESLTKRYYDVKDTGSLLPGHGGVLDRLDSMLLVSFAAGLLLFLGI